MSEFSYIFDGFDEVGQVPSLYFFSSFISYRLFTYGLLLCRLYVLL